MRKFSTLLLTSMFFYGCTLDSKLNVTPTKTDQTPQQTSTNQDSKNDDSNKLKDLPVKEVQAIPDTLIITEGSKVKGTASVIYNDNSRSSDLVWSSSDNTLAIVNSTTGEISGVKPGIVTIIATAQKDTSKRTSITVTVKRADVTEALTYVTPSEASVKIGGTTRLNAQIQMSDGSISPNVIWKSDSNSIALVSNGLVTGIAEGTTTVTAIAEGDSTKKASAKITVTKDSNNTQPASSSPTPQPQTSP
jgi:uncharacterized protein YjdB